MVSWIPISHALSNLFATTAPETTHLLARIFWWIHALVLLFFINYLPYSKHLHILTAIPNCFFRSFSFVTTVPRMVFKKGLTFGTSKVVQFSWKDLFDFLSCTECGRCEAACPAHNTDKPLNPRQVIHEGKLNLLANGKVILSSRPADTLASAPQDASMAIPLINGREESVSTDAIWACTTCGACMVKCPVFIEHVPKIVEMRRHLVMEKADFTEELIGFFENSEQRFNPWGIAPTDRAKWAQELDVKILADGAEVEYLFYVGCAGAFDSRNRQVTTAVTTILNAANLSWGILGTEEKCCGDSLRRLGNEYVFDQLVRDNIEIFKKYGIKKIITYCPHCFNTLKNDYKQFGADFEVIHHTQLIHALIKQGKITLKGNANGRTVIHDSCYLGRYNEIYKEPREILKGASQGNAPLEMQRRGQESFCCGAGGGRMWMEELIGKRIYLERTQEALKTNPSTIAVSCPYCMTMFEDGIKDEKEQDNVKVKDIAEIVVESMT
jgi:Fe-S oxidoreductase